jgi:hypothetical protein
MDSDEFPGPWQLCKSCQVPLHPEVGNLCAECARPPLDARPRVKRASTAELERLAARAARGEPLLPRPLAAQWQAPGQRPDTPNDQRPMEARAMTANGGEKPPVAIAKTAVTGKTPAATDTKPTAPPAPANRLASSNGAAPGRPRAEQLLDLLDGLTADDLAAVDEKIGKLQDRLTVLKDRRQVLGRLIGNARPEAPAAKAGRAPVRRANAGAPGGIGPHQLTALRLIAASAAGELSWKELLRESALTTRQLSRALHSPLFVQGQSGHWSASEAGRQALKRQQGRGRSGEAPARAKSASATPVAPAVDH